MRVLALILTMLTLCGVCAAEVKHAGGETPPPGAIRWDTYDVQDLKSPRQAYVPPVYQLGYSLADIRDIEVDNLGRLFTMDSARRMVAGFGVEGGLETLWLDQPTKLSMSFDMYYISIFSGGNLYLINQTKNDVYRLGQGGEVTALPGTVRNCAIATLPDGTYIIHTHEWQGKDTSLNVFRPDGTLKKKWQTPRFSSIALGPDGLIYCTLHDDMRILVYDMEGNQKREINVGILPLSATSSGDYSMGCLQVDGNGDMYVQLHVYVIRLDNNGKPIARWQVYKEPSPNGPRSAGMPHDLAVKNGVIYCLTSGGDIGEEIQAFAPDGQCIARYRYPRAPIELPRGIAIQPDGSYLVVQSATYRQTLLFDANGNKSSFGRGEGDVNPGSVVARNGYYYAANGYCLERVDRDGKNRVEIVAQDNKSLSGRLVADPRTGDMWVFGLNKAIVLGPDDKEVRRVEMKTDKKELPLLTEVTISPDGFIYMFDHRNKRIVKCDTDGQFVLSFGTEGSAFGQLLSPSAIAIGPEGQVLVADMGNSRIQAFSPDGTPLGMWGTRGTGDGQLDRPRGLVMGPGNTLWISDTYNDRIVKVPLADFWQQLTREIKSPAPYVAPQRVPAPIPGDVTVEGIVIAGTDDFKDVIYLEAADRSWGARVTLPTGEEARRGDRVRVTGVLELQEHAAKHIKAKIVEHLPQKKDVPDPLGMANLYVGDGYRPADKLLDSSNLGLLIKTWGKVVSVDLKNTRFMIADGSELGDTVGLEVYGGQLIAPIETWPKEGQYVGVTGVSALRPVGDGTFQPAIRLRAQEDLQILVEN